MSKDKITRRDFLRKTGLGIFGLGLAKNLYSEDDNYENKTIVILDFEGQGDSKKTIVPSIGYDLGKTIPFMLTEKLQGNGFSILSQDMLYAKLKGRGLNFNNILADPGLAEEFGIDGCISGIYTVFRGPQDDSINVNYTNLKTGNIEFSYSIENDIPFKLEYMIDKIGDRIIKYFKNNKSR